MALLAVSCLLQGHVCFEHRLKRGISGETKTMERMSRRSWEGYFLKAERSIGWAVDVFHNVTQRSQQMCLPGLSWTLLG